MAQLSRIRLHNIRNFADAAIDLRPVTVLIGPNNSGKSNLLGFLEFLGKVLGEGEFESAHLWQPWRRAGVEQPFGAELVLQSQGEIRYDFRFEPKSGGVLALQGEEFATGTGGGRAESGQRVGLVHRTSSSDVAFGSENRVCTTSVLRDRAVTEWSSRNELVAFLKGVRVHALDPRQLKLPAAIVESPRLQPDGAGLAAVIGDIKDQHPEAFERLEEDLRNCIPEVERLLLKTVSVEGQNRRQIEVRQGQRTYPAAVTSDGLILTVALLALVHHPNPPTLLCLEEPENGLHPRRLADLLDMVTRLAHPENGSAGAQVILTTHSPYLLDLFRDRPEDVVVVEPGPDGSTLHPLTTALERVHAGHDAPLGDLWYSGVLGGVPG